MTVQALISRLKKIEKVNKRAEVVIDLREFRLVDADYTHWGVLEVGVDFIPWRGSDGSRERKDGNERMRNVVVIS